MSGKEKKQLFNQPIAPPYELGENTTIILDKPNGVSNINFEILLELLMRDFDYISQLLGQRELSSAKKISQKEIDQGKQEFEKIRESLHHNASVFLDDEDKYLQMSLFMYDAIIAVNSMFNNRDKGSAININDIKKLLPMMILSYQHRTGHEITSPDTKNETETAQQIRETYEILIQYIKQTQNIWTW